MVTDDAAVAARRARFVELGGVVPTSVADRVLLEAILGSGDFLPGLLFAEVGQLATLMADPWLRRPKPPELTARAVAAATGGARDLRSLQRALRRGASLRDVAARRAGAGVGDDRGGGARAVGVRRRLPRGGGHLLRLRELSRELGEPRTERRRAGAVRGDGDGQAGRGGAELLVRRRRLLLLRHRRGRGRRARRRRAPDAARVLRGAGPPGHRRPRRAHRRRDGLPRRPAAAARGAQRPAVATRSAAAEGYYETFGRTWERQALAAGPSLRRAIGPGRRALRDARAVHLPAQHRSRAGRGDTRAARAVPRSGRRRRRAGRDRLRRQAGGGRDPRRRDGRPGAAAPACRQAARAARAQHAAGAPPAGRRRPALGSRGLDAADRLSFLAPAGAPGPGGDGGAAAPAPRRRRRARRGWPRGWGSRISPRSTRRWRRSAPRSRRSPRRWAIPPEARRAEAQRLLDPMRDRAELERLAGAAGFRDTDAAADTLERLGARLPVALLEATLASPDPDRALVHFRDLVWRGSGALLALLRDEPHLARYAGDPVRDQRSPGRSADPPAQARGSRSSPVSAIGVRSRGDLADAPRQGSQRRRGGGGCGRSGASRPTRPCASACTTSPAA